MVDLRSLLSPWYSAWNPTLVPEFCRTIHRIWHSGRLCTEYTRNSFFLNLSYYSGFSPMWFRRTDINSVERTAEFHGTNEYSGCDRHVKYSACELLYNEDDLNVTMCDMPFFPQPRHQQQPLVVTTSFDKTWQLPYKRCV